MYSTSTTSGTSVSLIRFNDSNGVWCGKGGSTSANISFNGYNLTSINADTQYDFVLKYWNGTATFSLGDISISFNISLTKISEIVSRGGTHLNYIKVKTL